jgi:hypothetical protein
MDFLHVDNLEYEKNYIFWYILNFNALFVFGLFRNFSNLENYQ